MISAEDDVLRFQITIELHSLDRVLLEIGDGDYIASQKELLTLMAIDGGAECPSLHRVRLAHLLWLSDLIDLRHVWVDLEDLVVEKKDVNLLAGSVSCRKFAAVAILFVDMHVTLSWSVCFKWTCMSHVFTVG